MAEVITKKRSFFKTFLISLLILIILFSAGIFALDKLGGLRIFSGSENLMDQMTPIAGDSKFAEEFADSKRVNVLLMGINQKLTDTIMLASYDMDTQRVDLISVPRDIYYPREGYPGPTYDKINAVYGSHGAVGTAEAVSDVLMGMPIHYYAVIGFEGVGKIVDALGGVPINIPMDMNYETHNENPPLIIHLKAGEQVLDSETAIKYLRFRKGYAEGDMGRVKAQQEFMKSAFKQAIGLKLPKVADSVLKNVDSDLPLGMAVKLAWKGKNLSSSDLYTHTVPGEPVKMEGLWFYIADQEGIELMIREIYSIKSGNAS